MREPPVQLVVAGVDGSRECRAAVDLAASEATLRRCPLRLVSAAGGLSGSFRPYLASVIRRLRASRPELTATAGVVRGDIASALVETSRTATLVVVSHTPDGDAPTGPAYAQVAAHAFCPTIVAPAAGAAGQGGPVLVGLEVSPNDEAVIAFAFEEAALRGVPLVAVHVWSGIPGTALGCISPFGYGLWQAQERADRLLAETLAGWADKYPTVPVRRMPLYDANPARTLPQACGGAGLAVVGASQYGARAVQLLGPVTRALLDGGPCSVAVVRGARG